MAKKDVDVRFNLIDNFTSSFKKTIEMLTAGTKKAQNAWKSLVMEFPAWEQRLLQR